MNLTGELPDILSLIFFFAILSLVPFIAVMATSFVKISVVLSLVRNALGVQQIPPNVAINGLALILTLFIMAPIGSKMFDLAQERDFKLANKEQFKTNLEETMQPYRAFLLKHTNQSHRQFFLDHAKENWPKDSGITATEDSLFVLLPAFTISELTKAFEVGFLIYLPFVVIDLVVSNVLLALGMMMVSPMTISLPFKLLLFVLLDGWTKLIQGLIMSY